MITIDEFIESTKSVWQVSKGCVICRDNIAVPTELNISTDKNLKNKVEEIGVDSKTIKYNLFFTVSNDSKKRVGYQYMLIYLRADKTVSCVEFGSCTKVFLNTTKNLGMVNGIKYISRKSLRSINAEVFFF